MAKIDAVLIPGLIIRESANDGSDFSNPTADYRVLFLGEDGLLHVRDSSGTVSSPYSGGGGTPTFVGVRGSRTAAQTGIVTATLTAISFNAADTYDTSAFHDPAGANPSRFVVPSGKDGYYAMHARVQWDTNNTGIRLAAIRLNGTTNLDEDEVAAFGSPVDGVTNEVATTFSLVATDYVEVMVYQTSGGNRDTRGAASGVHFEMHLIGT